MSERTYVITIREAPRSNNRTYRTTNARHAEKKRWEGMFLAELMIAKAQKGMTFCTATVVVRWKQRNHQDIENFRQAVMKPLADALVWGGYLSDDTADWFKGGEMTAEYPQEWPYQDPRLKAETIVRLDAVYA